MFSPDFGGWRRFREILQIYLQNLSFISLITNSQYIILFINIFTSLFPVFQTSKVTATSSSKVAPLLIGRSSDAPPNKVSGFWVRDSTLLIIHCAAAMIAVIWFFYYHIRSPSVPRFRFLSFFFPFRFNLLSGDGERWLQIIQKGCFWRSRLVFLLGPVLL